MTAAEARELVHRAGCAATVERLVAAAPPLSPDQRRALAAMRKGGRHATG